MKKLSFLLVILILGCTTVVDDTRISKLENKLDSLMKLKPKTDTLYSSHTVYTNNTIYNFSVDSTFIVTDTLWVYDTTALAKMSHGKCFLRNAHYIILGPNADTLDVDRFLRALIGDAKNIMIR